MDPGRIDPPIGEIETDWSDIFLAHYGDQDRARAALARLMYRYVGAVRRYSLNVLRDPDLADELAQEFAVRVLRGDFHRADPGRGRFRDFVRTAARNLIHDHFRRLKNRPRHLNLDDQEPADPRGEAGPPDAEFDAVWRDQLMQRAWSSLADEERRTGRPLHTVLSLRSDNPDLISGRLAVLASARLGRPVSATWVRQMLRRARARLVDFLLDEIAATLAGRSYADLEQEVIDLDLFAYCREGLRRRASGGPPAGSGEQQDLEL